MPTEFVLYDASWEYYSYDSSKRSGSGEPYSLFKLDGNEIIGTDGSFNHNSSSDGSERRDERIFGKINEITKDVLHIGDLWYNYCKDDGFGTGIDEGSSNIAIVLIYKQP